MFYPVKPLVVNQPFGTHPEIYAQFGLMGHNGLDLESVHGQPVYAAHDGVCHPEIDANQGNGVVLRTLVPYDYQGLPTFFKTIYWHLIKADAVVKEGQHVQAGQLIGYADSTGFSTGDHLHFGLKPQQWDENNWIWYNTDQKNGYLGAIDPTPYWNGLYAQDLVVKHQFTATIIYGETSLEVVALQKALKALGFFPKLQPETGYYGIITKNSVYNFQLHYAVAPPSQLDSGNTVGPKTRAMLNKVT